jgi:hypothetical protein
MKKKKLNSKASNKLLEVQEHTRFRFAHEDNVTRVSVALAMAGYLIKIEHDGEFTVVVVFGRPVTIGI